MQNVNKCTHCIVVDHASLNINWQNYFQLDDVTPRNMGLSNTSFAAFPISSQSNLLHTLFSGFAGSITNGLQLKAHIVTTISGKILVTEVRFNVWGKID